MHSLLENYLAEVASHLSALPPKRRDEELREMRAHLENAVIVSRELGQTEDEAAQNVMTQFGTPQDLGENVVWAWRRGEVLNKKSLFGAAAVTTLVLCLMTFLMNQTWYYSILNILLPRTFLLYCGKHPAYGMALTQAMLLGNFALAGGVAGSLFPKQAVRGVCLGLVAFWIGWVAVDGVGYGGIWRLLFWICENGWTLTAIISAWMGSRARVAWSGRARVAHQ